MRFALKTVLLFICTCLIYYHHKWQTCDEVVIKSIKEVIVRADGTSLEAILNDRFGCDANIFWAVEPRYLDFIHGVGGANVVAVVLSQGSEMRHPAFKWRWSRNCVIALTPETASLMDGGKTTKTSGVDPYGLAN